MAWSVRSVVLSTTVFAQVSLEAVLPHLSFYILKGPLSGVAHVVVATSRYSAATVEYYRGIFQRFSSRVPPLQLLPYRGSKRDVEALVDYIYTTLGVDLDYIITFADVPENGREIDGPDDKSELAHRIMLVKLLRLLGATKLRRRAVKSLPAQRKSSSRRHPIMTCLATMISVQNLRSPANRSSITALQIAGVNIFALYALS